MNKMRVYFSSVKRQVVSCFSLEKRFIYVSPLRLGCGHGLPGIFACLEGAAAMHSLASRTSMLRSCNVSPYPGQWKSPDACYDIILMAETVYSISTLQHLYGLIKKCIGRPHGVVYLAAKKHYFGVGGGTRRFLSVVEKDGILASIMVAEVADGSSNGREVWRLSSRLGVHVD